MPTGAEQRQHEPVPARVWALLASEASTAVVFWRGPTRWTRLYLWDTRTAAITPGSWFTGRLYEGLSDLSPDGEHLTYVSRNESKRRQDKARAQFGEDLWCWTALSRPPWVRALGLWNASDGWSGGAVFAGNRALRLNHLPGTGALIEPGGFTVETVPRDRWTSVFLESLKRTGWRVAQSPERWKLGGPARPVILHKGHLELRYISPASRRRRDYVEFSWHGEQPVPGLSRASWADFDRAGRLVYARNGCLYTDTQGSEHEIANLNLDQPDRRPVGRAEAAESS